MGRLFHLHPRKARDGGFHRRLPASPFRRPDHWVSQRVVRDTRGPDCLGLVISHQEHPALLPAVMGITDDGASFGGAGVGVSGSRRSSLAPCGFARIRGLRRLDHDKAVEHHIAAAEPRET